jgi:ribosomal protein L3 glutamine methyltransferase
MNVTVGTAIEDTAAALEAAGLAFGHGFDSAWDEAVALVLDVTGHPDDRRVLGEAVGEAELARIRALTRRRCEAREPLAYLLGRCTFAGYEFLLEPGIVVPRSPIGGLLTGRLAPWLDREPARIVDLCCGSGCIGIVAAHVFPGARVDLADLDPRAVALSRRNVAMHGLEDRVAVHQSDLFDALPAGRWDLMLSNPPYVDAADMGSLPAEYRHEPAHGLAGGDDGLEVVARILEALPERLAAGGMLVCEVGASVPALLRRYPSLPCVWPDLPEGGEGVFLLSADG